MNKEKIEKYCIHAIIAGKRVFVGKTTSDVLFAYSATIGPVVVSHTAESKVILSTSLSAYRYNKDTDISLWFGIKKIIDRINTYAITA